MRTKIRAEKICQALKETYTDRFGLVQITVICLKFKVKYLIQQMRKASNSAQELKPVSR